MVAALPGKDSLEKMKVQRWCFGRLNSDECCQNTFLQSQFDYWFIGIRPLIQDEIATHGWGYFLNPRPIQSTGAMCSKLNIQGKLGKFNGNYGCFFDCEELRLPEELSRERMKYLADITEDELIKGKLSRLKQFSKVTRFLLICLDDLISEERQADDERHEFKGQGYKRLMGVCTAPVPEAGVVLLPLSPYAIEAVHSVTCLDEWDFLIDQSSLG